MDVKNFDWKDYFYPLYKFHIKDGNRLHIHKSFWKYHRRIEYLKIIWSRVKRSYRRHLIAYKLFSNMRPKVGTTILSNKHLKQKKRSDNSLKIYNLDVDSFLIFSRILMDTLAELGAHLLEKPKGFPFTFSDQVSELKKLDAGDGIYKKYVDLVRKNSYWFQMLQATRDKLIVHPKGYVNSTKYSQDGEISLVRFDFDKAWHGPEDAKRLFDQKYNDLIKLRDKYKDSNSSLKDENNFWELIRIFSESDFEMMGEDVKILTEIIQSYGTEISIRYLEFIADRINVLIKEFAEIFRTY